MKIFWSWQSDTPETTGRYFVRDALIEAVAQLKIPEDIEEPTTAANREAIHADFDREGVTAARHSPPPSRGKSRRQQCLSPTSRRFLGCRRVRTSRKSVI
jgi:hypothetical protein